MAHRKKRGLVRNIFSSFLASAFALSLFCNPASAQLPVPKDKKVQVAIESVNKNLEKKNDPDKRDLAIVLDDEIVKYYEYDVDEIFTDFKENVLEHFKKRYGIEFDIDYVLYFDSKMSDNFYLLDNAVINFPLKDLDVDGIIALSGENKDNLSPYGIAYLLGDYAVINDPGNEPRIALHELNHWFGALDYKQGHPLYNERTIMSYAYLNETRWLDWPNSNRVSKYSQRPWRFDLEFELDREKLNKYFDSFGDKQEDIKQMFLFSRANKTFTEQINFARKVQKHHPDDPQLMFYLAEILWHSPGRKDQAREYYNKLVGMDIKDEFVFAGITKRFWDEKKYDLETPLYDIDTALKLAEKAVELYPEKSFLLYNLGWTYYLKQNYKAASNQMEKALELRLKKEVPLHMLDKDLVNDLSLAYDKLNDFDNWFKYRNMLIEIDPFDGGNYHDFANSLLDKQKQPEYALTLAKKAIELYPNTEEFERTLVKAYKANGMFEKASELEKRMRSKHAPQEEPIWNLITFSY